MEVSPLPKGFSHRKLYELGQLMGNIRRTVITDIYDKDLDHRWGINCMIFGRIIRGMRAAADNSMSEWLKVSEPGLHFRFEVDGRPLGFYRGREDRLAPKGQVKITPAEEIGLQLAFAFYPEPELRFYRIMYETDPETLLMSRVALVALDEDRRPHKAWDISRPPTDLTLSGADEVVLLPAFPMEVIADVEDEEEEQLRKEADL